LMRLRNPPIYQDLPQRTDAVDLNIGDQVLVSHQDGLGEYGVGYDRRPMILIKSTHQGDNVTHQALDLSLILVGEAQWGPDSLPTMAEDGTEEEQALYWTWTENDGTVPGGGFGSEWR
jgi:hypothetical protein